MPIKPAPLSAAVAAVVVFSMAGGTALATPITRHFEFSSTSGPLLFGPNIGSFTYDDSVAPIGGGYVFQTNLFSDLDVSFDMFSFDETTANSGWLQFDASGGLLEAHFGTDCFAGGCGVSSGTNSWWIRVGLAGSSVNDFSYSGYKGATQFYQTFENRLVSVPEPGIIALLGLGLAGLAATRRRKP